MTEIPTMIESTTRTVEFLTIFRMLNTQHGLWLKHSRNHIHNYSRHCQLNLSPEVLESPSEAVPDQSRPLLRSRAEIRDSLLAAASTGLMSVLAESPPLATRTGRSGLMDSLGQTFHSGNVNCDSFWFGGFSCDNN